MKKLVFIIFILFLFSLTSCNNNEKITIKFNSNTIENYSDIVIDDNTKVLLPIPKKEGFIFLGWFDKNGEQYTNETIFQKDVQLEAKFEIIQLTVTFLDYDDRVIEVIKVNYGEQVMNPPIPNRDGYQFSGWNLSNITKDLILKAEYYQTYKVKFLDYDGSIINEQNVKANNDALEPDYPSREGYQFIGWNKNFYNISSDLIVTALYDEVSDGLVFNITEDGYEVSDYTGFDVNVKIPSKYNLIDVVYIGEKAFSQNWNIQSVLLPNTIKKIKDSAFFECYELSEINLPETMLEIGSKAFEGCEKLKSIVIGATIIKESAFYNCTSLTSITILNSVTTIDSWAFQGCSSLLEITIPSSVTSIGKNAFSWCQKLSKIYTPMDNYTKLKNLLDSAGNIYTSFTIVGIE